MVSLARSASDINPEDVFPPSQLPGASAAWGRVMMDRMVALEKAVLAGGQSIDGTNRYLASSSASLADQIADILATQDRLMATESYQTETPLAFPVPSGVYTTVLTQTVEVPLGYDAVDLVTFGFGLGYADNAASTYFYGLIVVNGVNGISSIDGPVSSTGDNTGTVSPNDARSLTGVSGQNITLEFKVKQDSGTTWGAATNRAKMSTLAIFHN